MLIESSSYLRLFNHGIGIHLLESDKNIPEKKGKINPKDNHISFQCSDMGLVMQKMEEMKMEYVTAKVEEGGVIVDQLFFHDPDGYMVEICNCQNLPVLPISSCPIKLITNTNANHTSSSSSFYGRSASLIWYMIFGLRNLGEVLLWCLDLIPLPRLYFKLKTLVHNLLTVIRVFKSTVEVIFISS